MEIKLGDKINFWSVKDTVVKINGDFVDTYSYVNVPLCECELVIKKKKPSKKAIKVIKEFSLLVDKLIELKKLSNPVPEYKKGGVPECKMGMGELIYAKSFKDVLNEKIDVCSDECFNSVVNNDDFIKGIWDKNMFSIPVKEKEITDITVLVGGLPAKFTIDKNVITILDLDDK